MDAVELKTVNRRRRRVIVAFVLVLVSLGAWWYWPRGDARFVGRWAMSDGAILPHLREIELQANGESRNWILAPNRTIVGVSRWDWTVDDQVLEFTEISTAPAAGPSYLIELIEYVYRRLSGPRETPTRMRILEITRDRITLETMPIVAGYEPQEVILTRIRVD